MILLKLEKLEVAYQRVITAVQGVSLEVPKGSIVALLGQSFPPFWLGLMLILLLGTQLKLLPPSGFQGPQYLIMPGLIRGSRWQAGEQVHDLRVVDRDRQ